ncbi:MAG: PfkB family carbohydrate kinase [Proteobacteria bacterium]|nr:PfkB family carbohydrate kinase [Pseudomonadota bacterium]
MNATSNPRIVCAGITTLDFIYAVDVMPSEPLKYRSNAMVTSGGGLAGNAATACARLGASVRLVARLGDDFWADPMIAELERDGVDCTLVRRCPGHRSPVSAVVVDPKGERLVVSYSDPDIPSDTGWIPADLATQADALYAETRWIEAALAVLPQARAAGIPSVLDADRKPTRPEVLALASHVGFSAPALREFTGIDDLPAALAHASTGIANVYLVTDGANGAWYMDGGEVVHVPAFPVTSVDTLGAGDTWHGALAVALAGRQPLERAVRFANAAAALKCTEFGGRKGMPTRPRVEALLAAA